MSDLSWHMERRLGVGGSDVAPIMGISQWATPLDIYLEKIGERKSNPETKFQRWGKRLEPVIRQEYADVTGRSVRVHTKPLVHPKHDFMRANLDGETECGRIFEAKTARIGEDWGDEGTDQVPQSYLFQVQHYMAVTGCKVADIAVLIQGSDFRIYTVEADPEIHEMLVEVEAEFWRQVSERTPPEPRNARDAVNLWGRISKGRSVLAGEEEVAAIKELRRIQFEIEVLKDRAEDHKLTCMATMGDADRLIDVRGGTLATWRTQDGRYGPFRAFKVK